MKDFKAPIATDVGLRAQMAYFAQNKPAPLTKMAIGSGKPPDSSYIPQMTGLVKEEKVIPITEVLLDPENPCVTICGIVDYMEVLTPFEVCELGLYILDPISNTETLYCYTYTDRSELAPAKTHATELFNISTLISRAQEIIIPDYNVAPYVLRSEVNSFKTVVSADTPSDIFDMWLKPLGKIDGWDEWNDLTGVIGDIGVGGYTLNIEGVHFGDDKPDNNLLLWMKPLT